MKKLSVFLLALFALFALTACGGGNNDKPTTPAGDDTPTTPAGDDTPTIPAGDDTVDTSKVLENTANFYHVVGAFAGDWKALDTNKMTATSIDDVTALDATLGASLKEKNVKYLYKMTGYPLAPVAGYEKNALVGNEVKVFDGGFTFKVIRSTYDTEDETYASEWIPNAHDAHAEALTSNYFVPNWSETPDANNFSWADDCVVTSGAGFYTIVFAQYENGVSSEENCAFGIGAVLEKAIDMDKVLANPDQAINYHVVGATAGDWKPLDTNKAKAISLTELAAIDKAACKAAIVNGAKYVYAYEDYKLVGGASYTKNMGRDEAGETRVVNGGFTFKVIRSTYDEEDETYASEWIPDPNTASVGTLSDNLWYPKWVEKAAEGEEWMGTWAEDGGLWTAQDGLYNIVVFDYGRVSTLETPGFAFGAYLTQEIEKEKTPEEKMQIEFDALKEAGESGAVGEVDYTFTGKVVAVSTTYSDSYKNWNVHMIVELPEGTFVYLFNCQFLVDGEYGYNNNAADKDPADEYPVDSEVKFTGKITYFVKGEVVGGAIGDATAEIEFAKPQMIEDTYHDITVRGIDAAAANVYWYGANKDNPAWPGNAMTKNEDGSFTATVADGSTIIFNWAVDETTNAQTVNLEQVEGENCWTLGEADAEGKYAATAAKCYFTSVTATGVVEDLKAIAAANVDAEGAAAPITVPEEFDLYVWFWGGSATGWFEAFDQTTGAFKVAEGTTGCCFVMVAKGVTPSWDAKIVQTGDYVIAAGVATKKAA